MAENHYNVTPFAYVLNDTLKYIDPLGLDTITATDKLPDSYNPQKDVLAIEEVVFTAKVTKNVETSPPAHSTALTIGMTTGTIGGMIDGPLPYADVTLGLVAFSTAYLAIKSNKLGVSLATTSTTSYGTLSLSEIIDGMVNSKSSGKNERHGDGGRTQSKVEKQIQQLEAQLSTATGSEKKKILQKIKNMRESAQKARKDIFYDTIFNTI